MNNHPNHPLRILKVLDTHLTSDTRLILYGRAALALGFPDPYPAFFATFDVDAILPEVEMRAIEGDTQFWDALEKTNKELEMEGLYMTHLFSDQQVILSEDWLLKIEPLKIQNLRNLSLFRPSTPDLILTKMMRVDPQDREDVKFLLNQLSMPRESLPEIIEGAQVPAIQEIQDAFKTNWQWLQDQ